MQKNKIMRRFLYNDLLKWKADSARKPLILQGARQVGKTWLMKEFGKNEYKNYVYINFDKDNWAKSIFIQDYNIERILLILQAQTGINIKPEDTLIIFDEIQEAERGLSVLKYFCEEAPSYHVMAAGSLLGVAMHKGMSFPVGKVDMLSLNPLTFNEFLLAMGEEQKFNMLIQKEWEIIKFLDPQYVDLLRQYYFVGGMPEAVASYIKNKDLQRIRKIQHDILIAYRNDISKHAPINEIPRINMVLDSIPSQLAKENRKFVFGMLRNGARAKDFELAIQWLIDAGIIKKVNLAKEPRIPLKFYEDISIFKLFLLDCGLMGCLAEAPAKLILTSNDIFKEYKGAFTEAFVHQQLLSKYINIYYWSSNDSKCEIDLMIQKEDSVIPIEIKAEVSVHSQSLHTFCTSKYNGIKGLRCSMKSYIDQDWMENIPLYSVESFL